MARLSVLLLTLLTFGLAACGDDSDDAIQPPPTGGAATATGDGEPAPAPEEPAAEGACVKKEEPGGSTKSLPCPTPTLAEGKTNVVTFKTSEGSFEITLDAERAPETANSVAYLAEEGFYDGLDFHRVVPDFVIQGGDPNGNGSGGPGYSVTEAPPSDQRYTRGVVAMAKGATDAPGASGSQFFVVSTADTGLPAEYAVVGKVTKGLGTVDKITALGEGDGPPSKEVEITSAKLSSR